ncbi:MAG: hypothetical protein J0M18_14005 [Ignavibacteria bacterium]|nr:hypothetical protein [Ignavibacteria bacterium]
MKKLIKYFLILSIFITENLFAQSEIADKGMDMDTYKTWMTVVVMGMICIMFAILLFGGGGEEESNIENAVLQIPDIFINTQANAFPGYSHNWLPGVSLELQKIRILIISILIIFSVILLLLII